MKAVPIILNLPSPFQKRKKKLYPNMSTARLTPIEILNAGILLFPQNIWFKVSFERKFP